MLILGLVDVPWWGILTILIIAWLMYTSRDFNYFKKQGVPGPQPYPVLGTMFTMFVEPIAERDARHVLLYNDVGCHGEFLGSRATIVVYDAEMLSEIMVKKFSVFTNRMVMKTGSPNFDNMLVSLEDAHWKHVRSEISPTFTTGKLKQMNQEINRCAQALAGNLEEQSKTGEDMEIREYCGAYTMDVIASTAFGIRVESQKDKNNEFVDHARRAFLVKPTNPMLLLLLFFPALAGLLEMFGVSTDIFPKDIRDFFSNITKQAMEMRKEDEDPLRSDFLQLMIRAQRGENISDDGDGKSDQEKSAGTGLTTDEIMANAMLFFVNGYDTTAASLSFFMYNMARHRHIQEKLMEEIENVVSDKEFIDQGLLQDMPYLDQCVSENLRLYPSAIRVNRVAKEDVTVKNIFIRKGMAVVIPIYGIHMDPCKWPEPGKFNPERFSPENRKNRHPYHFLPFGNGPRNCIGMRLALQELKVAIIHVLRKVKPTTCGKTEIPIVLQKGSSQLKAKNGIFLKMEPRPQKVQLTEN